MMPMNDPCPKCGMPMKTPAEAFIHADDYGLNELPFCLIPRVGRLLEKFAGVQTRGPTPTQISEAEIQAALKFGEQLGD